MAPGEIKFKFTGTTDNGIGTPYVNNGEITKASTSALEDTEKPKATSTQEEKAELGGHIDQLVLQVNDIIENIQEKDDNGLLFIDTEIGTENVIKGKKEVDRIFKKWNEVVERYEDNDEKSEELLGLLEECKKELAEFELDMEKWKKTKKERDEFLNLDENKNWEDVFKEARGKILRSDKTKAEFELEHPGINLELDFDYDIEKKIEYYLQQSDDHVDSFHDTEKQTWRKVLAAAKMILLNKKPKTCVILEGNTYMTDSHIFESDEEKKEKLKKEIKWNLRKNVKEKIKQYCNENSIKNIEGSEIKRDAHLAGVAAMLVGKILDDQDKTQELINAYIDNPAVISTTAEDLMKELENNETLIHELVLKNYIYNVLGTANKKGKKGSSLNEEQLKALYDEILVEEKIVEVIEKFAEQRDDDSESAIDDSDKKTIFIAINRKLKQKLAELSGDNSTKVKPDDTANDNVNVAQKEVVDVETKGDGKKETKKKIKKAELKKDDGNTDAEVGKEKVEGKEKEAANEEVKKEKTEEEIMEEMYAKLEYVTFGQVSVELFQTWKDGYDEFAKENNISEVEVGKQIKNDIMDILSRYLKSGKDEQQKILEYIMKKIK